MSDKKKRCYHCEHSGSMFKISSGTHCDGVLVFKWSETQVKVKEVLELTPVPPLFGHISGRKGLTHWLVFMTPTRR